ncbi:TPA: hypothetical protein HA251_00430, partial [Candidatus Woesearchaeota archaeon]|nr:hypothetical protein [Candidatus Woesearchaeota archaeon]
TDIAASFPLPLDIDTQQYTIPPGRPKDFLTISTMEELDDYAKIYLAGQTFINMSRITQRHDTGMHVFFLCSPFYHANITPIPFVAPSAHTTRGMHGLQGTVDYGRNHVFAIGLPFPHAANGSLIAHELFHLLVDDPAHNYENGRQVAHCDTITQGARCIMNPPAQVAYNSAGKSRDPLGLEFCTSCKYALSTAVHR